ncbi:hypothetical protein AAHZ94_35080, partial [Streptomyces sp. HSW2009]|uniref:hypothetical protein n=1 Tax=Streptomyces sp. HSW2009 TaxID=3142890 RepID=UPI0032EDC065
PPPPPPRLVFSYRPDRPSSLGVRLGGSVWCIRDSPATERDDLGGAPYEEAGNARGNAPDADVGWRSPERRDPAERKQPKDPADGAPAAGPAAPPGAAPPPPRPRRRAPGAGAVAGAAPPR